MDNDKRQEKSWNDPPMFSMDQLNKASSTVPLSKRYRYPQQAPPVMQPASNSMYQTPTYGYPQPPDPSFNQTQYGQFNANQSTFNNQPITPQGSYMNPSQAQPMSAYQANPSGYPYASNAGQASLTQMPQYGVNSQGYSATSQTLPPQPSNLSYPNPTNAFPQARY